MGAALYLNRVSIDNDCLDTNHPDSEPFFKDVGEFFALLTEDPDTLNIAIAAMQDDSEGSPTYHIREALKNYRMGDTEEAGREYGLFLAGALSGVY